MAKNRFWKNEKPGQSDGGMSRRGVYISLLFEFRVKQCCALHGEVLHPLYFQFVSTSRHIRLITVLIVEIPDTEIGGNGLAHLLRLFVKFRKDFGLQLLLFGSQPLADKLAELRILPEAVEPVWIPSISSPTRSTHWWTTVSSASLTRNTTTSTG